MTLNCLAKFCTSCNYVLSFDSEYVEHLQIFAQMSQTSTSNNLHVTFGIISKTGVSPALIFIGSVVHESTRE